MEVETEEGLWQLRRTALGGEGRRSSWHCTLISHSLPRLPKNGFYLDSKAQGKVCPEHWEGDDGCSLARHQFVQRESFMSRYVCPVLVSFLAISATLIVTVSILYWNYSETMYAFMITVFNNFIR